MTPLPPSLDPWVYRLLPTRPDILTLWDQFINGLSRVSTCAEHMEHAVTGLRKARAAYRGCDTAFRRIWWGEEIRRMYVRWVAACVRINVTERFLMREIRAITRYIIHRIPVPEPIEAKDIENLVALSMRVKHRNSGLQYIKDHAREDIGGLVDIRRPFDLEIPPVDTPSARAVEYIDLATRVAVQRITRACRHACKEPLPSLPTSAYAFIFPLQPIRETYIPPTPPPPTEATAASHPRPTPVE